MPDGKIIIKHLFLSILTVTFLAQAISLTSAVLGPATGTRSNYNPVFPAFSDVSRHHPYYHSILELKNEGAIKGYKDGSFQPDKTINRVEFLKILLEATGQYGPERDRLGTVIMSNQGLNFSDALDQQWYIPYLRYATQRQIVRGYADGSFKPGNPINLAEALKMIFTTFELPTVQFIREPDNWYEYYTAALNGDFETETGLDRNKDIAKHINRGEMTALISYLREVKNALDKTAPEDESEVISRVIEIPERGKTEVKEPLLLTQKFLSRGLHTITTHITYDTSCRTPKTTYQRISHAPQPDEIHLEIYDTDIPLFGEETCGPKTIEHKVEFTIKGNADMNFSKLTAYGDEVQFILHDLHNEVKHFYNPLHLTKVGPNEQGKYILDGFIRAKSDCQEIRHQVHEYLGDTPHTQIEFSVVNTKESCRTALTEYPVTVTVSQAGNVRARINEQAIGVNIVSPPPEETGDPNFYNLDIRRSRHNKWLVPEYDY